MYVSAAGFTRNHKRAPEDHVLIPFPAETQCMKCHKYDHAVREVTEG